MGDAGHIIAEQIDNHQIFGPLLGIIMQMSDAPGIFSRVTRTFGGALHRLGRDPPVLQGEEEFGRQRQEPILPRPDDPAKAGLRTTPKPRINGQWVTRRAHIGPDRQIGLINIARCDECLHMVMRLGIIGPAKARTRGIGPAACRIGQPVRHLLCWNFLIARKARKPDQRDIKGATARCKPILQRKPRLITQETRPIPASTDPRHQIRHLGRIPRLHNLQRIAIKPRGRATRTGIIQKHKGAGRNGRCHAPPLAGLERKGQTGHIRDGTNLRPSPISPISSP